MTSLFGGSSAKPTPDACRYALKHCAGEIESHTACPDITARVEQFKDRVRNELALQNAQEIMNKVNEKCFAKCVPKPGSSLSSSEEKCLSQCMDRYLDAFDLVNRSYVARLRKERLDQQSSPDSL